MIVAARCLLLLLLCQAAAAEGPPPAPARFLEGLVSTGADDAHVAFTPDGKTLYFIRSTPDFAHWTVLESHLRRGRWTRPEVAPFSGEWSDADVFVTRDGRRLFFISNRPVDGEVARPDTEIWVMERRADGALGPPRHLAELSSPGDEWFPTLTDDGTLYFGSERPGGLGKSDLWRARPQGDGFAPPENLGDAVNGPEQEIEPLVAPDGSWLVFAANGRPEGKGAYDLFITFPCHGGWTPPRPLGGGVNSSGWDFGPRFSPDGRTFLFTSNRSDLPGRPRGRLDLAALTRLLEGPGNGLRDVYQVDARALDLRSSCASGGLGAAAAPAAAAPVGEPGPASSATPELAWFQATEQELMDSIARGDRTPWERVTDSAYVSTSEEGEVLTRQQLLDDLRPLPAGLTGHMVVRDLTVQAYAGLAVVRFVAEEHETVFGQALTTRYRATDTFRRDGKAWKLAATHLSVVPADPPEQAGSRTGWPGLVGEYRLLPDGWTFTVELREGRLHGGRDPAKLRPMIPLAPNVFVVSGRPGEWIFVADESGRVARLVNLRKFTALVWTRVEPAPAR